MHRLGEEEGRDMDAMDHIMRPKVDMQIVEPSLKRTTHFTLTLVLSTSNRPLNNHNKVFNITCTL